MSGRLPVRPGSAGRSPDGFHVFVGVAEAVADLVGQDGAHDVGQAFSAVAPVVEDLSRNEEGGRSLPSAGW